jgi:hypothetical protein
VGLLLDQPLFHIHLAPYMPPLGFVDNSKFPDQCQGVHIGKIPQLVCSSFVVGNYNVPKPICQEHHGFGCLLKFYWLWHFVKHFVDLLVCMCLLVG